MPTRDNARAKVKGKKGKKSKRAKAAAAAAAAADAKAAPFSAAPMNGNAAPATPVNVATTGAATSRSSGRPQPSAASAAVAARPLATETGDRARRRPNLRVWLWLVAAVGGLLAIILADDAKNRTTETPGASKQTESPPPSAASPNETGRALPQTAARANEPPPSAASPNETGRALPQTAARANEPAPVAAAERPASPPEPSTERAPSVASDSNDKAAPATDAVGNLDVASNNAEKAKPASVAPKTAAMPDKGTIPAARAAPKSTAGVEPGTKPTQNSAASDPAAPKSLEPTASAGPKHPEPNATGASANLAVTGAAAHASKHGESAPAPPSAASAPDSSKPRNARAASAAYVVTFITRPLGASVTVGDQTVVAPGDIDLGSAPTHLKVVTKKPGFQTSSIWLDESMVDVATIGTSRRVYLTLQPAAEGDATRQP
jgi:hypothetical protein